MRVCYFGAYEADYDRNRILIRGLRESGVEVLTCHVPVWETMRHKTSALKSPRKLAAIAADLVSGYRRALQTYAALPPHDAIVVGYLGHLDVFIAKLLARRTGRPLVFDAFISLYDTLVNDRALFAKGSPPAQLAWWLDKASSSFADLVLLDTDAHIDYFCDEFRLDRSRFERVLVGADDALFRCSAAPVPSTTKTFTVLHYSKFSPLHGLEHVLDAMHRLADAPDVRFLLVGGGQLEDDIERRIDALGLRNVERRDWMEPSELRQAIANAGACLGIFGTSGKAQRVIPNKVYQCMASGGAIVTADTPGARELLVHERSALLCPPGDGAAIAEAILRLKRDPALSARISRGAFESFESDCAPAVVAGRLAERIARLVAERRPS